METVAENNTQTEAPPQDSGYGISQLAQEFSVSLRALRFYELQGLVSPTRIGNRRLYSEADRARLKLICTARDLELPLSTVRTILEAPADTHIDLLVSLAEDQLAFDEARCANRKAIIKNIKGTGAL